MLLDNFGLKQMPPQQVVPLAPVTLLLSRAGMSYNAGTLLTYLSRALYLYIVCLNTYTDE